MKRDKCLIVAFSHIGLDSRVQREIDALAAYDLYVVGYGEYERSGINYLQIKRPKWKWWRKIKQRLLFVFGMYEAAYWSLPQVKESLRKIPQYDYHAVIANDIETLPLVCRQIKCNKIIFDAHEYAPRQFDNDFWWSVFFAPFKRYLCAKYIPKANAVLTVSNSLAKEYEAKFSCSPFVLLNCPSFADIKPSRVGNIVKLVHHGYVSSARSLHLMIEAMYYVGPMYELDLILVPSSESQYFGYLQRLCAGMSNVRILSPVSASELLMVLNSYDAGVIFFPPVSFNLACCLPNKFFECVQARLAIIAGPSVEMEHYIAKYKIGLVADDFSVPGLVRAILSMGHEQLTYYKRNTHAAARDCSFDSERMKLLSVVENSVCHDLD